MLWSSNTRHPAKHIAQIRWRSEPPAPCAHRVSFNRRCTLSEPLRRCRVDIPRQPFTLEAAEEGPSRRVVPAVSLADHRALHAILFSERLVGVTSVLAPRSEWCASRSRCSGWPASLCITPSPDIRCATRGWSRNSPYFLANKTQDEL